MEVETQPLDESALSNRSHVSYRFHFWWRRRKAADLDSLLSWLDFIFFETILLIFAYLHEAILQSVPAKPATPAAVRPSASFDDDRPIKPQVFSPLEVWEQLGYGGAKEDDEVESPKAVALSILTSLVIFVMKILKYSTSVRRVVDE